MTPRRPDERGLRRLDDRVLPVAARGLAGAETAVRDTVRRVARRRPPLPVAALAAVLAATLAAGAAVAAGGRGEPAAPPATPPRQPSTAAVGPRPGQPVAGYLAAARARLDRLAGDAPTYAVVDLRRYVDPAGLRRLLGATAASRVWTHVPGDTANRLTPVQALPVSGVAAVPAALAAAAGQARRDAAAYARILRVLRAAPGTLPPAQLARYRELAAGAAAQAAALGPSCRCLFAALVRARPAALHRLAGTPGVRAVDPAPPGVPYGGIDATALRPETTGRQPTAAEG